MPSNQKPGLNSSRHQMFRDSRTLRMDGPTAQGVVLSRCGVTYSRQLGIPEPSFGDGTLLLLLESGPSPFDGLLSRAVFGEMAKRAQYDQGIIGQVSLVIGGRHGENHG
jgi:hypothetical protein